MEVRQAANAKDVKFYTTERLREEFHITGLFTPDNVKMVYSHIDRIITAGVIPVSETLTLEAGKELAADYFLQRREMGCINIGGKGVISVDGVEYVMNPRDGIYIGMGNKEITFKSEDASVPAKFYVSSCPAHTTYPTVKIDITKAKKVPCGSVEECNKRVINQYIHPEVMKSCQLAMGLTQLEVEVGYLFFDRRAQAKRKRYPRHHCCQSRRRCGSNVLFQSQRSYETCSGRRDFW